MALYSGEVEFDSLSGGASHDRHLARARRDGRGVELRIGRVEEVATRVLSCRGKSQSELSQCEGVLGEKRNSPW